MESPGNFYRKKVALPAELDAQLAKLEEEQKVTDQTMIEMRSAMGEQWDALKIALNESFERLKRSLDAIKSGA
jgi:hypothetical protein